MRTLQEKYNAVLEGNFSKTQFRRDAAMELPQFISNVNSFDDTVAILKNKGIVTEAKKQEPKYSTAKPADQVAPDVLDTGIKFELDKKHGTLDVTPEQYEKCREMAIKNLAKDVLYYVKQDSIQLETPAEQMEKVSLKEEVEEAIQNIENDEHTVKRIAKLTNQLLQDNPEDHSVKAYAISVKNDLESGDASRLKRYKDLLSIDDLKKDMEHYISHDVDQLEEEEDLDATEKAASAKIGKGEEFTDDDAAAVADKMPKIKKDAEFKLIGEDEPDDTPPETLEESEVVDLPMTAAGYSRGETYNTEKYGKVKIIDQLDGDDIPAAYGRFRVEKINEEDKDKPSFYDYPENKHLDDRDPEERRALKEMFKKIIVNLINE